MAKERKNAKIRELLWIPATDIPTTAGHPFYNQLNDILARHGFDELIDTIGAPILADGEPLHIPADRYFRVMMFGFFEGVESEKDLAWRVADSLSLRRFIGLALTERPPDHARLSATRRRLSIEVQRKLYKSMLSILKKEEQLRGILFGIDATTAEAKKAIQELKRRNTLNRYADYVARLEESEN